MPTGNLEILHDFSAVTNKVIVVIYENSNLAAEIDRAVLNAPHIAGDVTIFDNLRLVLHRVKCYESTDGVTLQTLLHSWTVQVKKTKTVVKPFFYTVGGNRTNITESTGSEVWADPIADDSSIVDERLASASSVVLFSEGGVLRHPNINYQLKLTGGWDLIGGETFSDVEKWTAIASFDVNVVEDGSSSSQQDDINIITASADFDDTYYSKNNVAAFSSAIGTTTFPDFNLIPSGTKARFSTYSGSQRYWKFQFASGNTVRLNDEDKNVLYLRKNQHVELFWKVDSVSGDVKCYITDSFLEVEKIGMRVLVDRWDFANGHNGNKILLDGTQYNLSDYPGFDEDHLQKLDPSQIVTTTQWTGDTTKQHCYAVDRLGGVFIVPKDQDMHYRALTTFDGVNGMPGAYTPDAIKQTSGSIDIPSRDLKNDGTTGPDLTGPDGGASSGSKRTFSFTIGTSPENTVKAVRLYAAVYI
jgi:hypothetical protein